MNNIIANFQQIVDFAHEYGLPLDKKRAILREYLQTKILTTFYQEKLATNLFFVGGTSLRLLRELDRFSEDLDFDVVGISGSQTDLLVKTGHEKILKENIKIDLYRNVTKERTYYEFRFPDLLSQLGLSQNRDEKLMIKLDFEFFWKGQTREVLLLNRYGLIVNLITKPLDQMLVEKLYAYLHREQTQARDLYDLVWLITHRAKFDLRFAQKNKMSDLLIRQAKDKFTKEAKKIKLLESKLKPYLFEEKDSQKINFFPQVLETISQKR